MRLGMLRRRSVSHNKGPILFRSMWKRNSLSVRGCLGQLAQATLSRGCGQPGQEGRSGELRTVIVGLLT